MTERTVRVANGVREVVLTFGGGESWVCYTIVPREIIKQSVIKQKEEGYTVPNIMHGFVDSPYYGGPGRSFVRKPYIYAKNRRFYVFCQSGGLDI